MGSPLDRSATWPYEEGEPGRFSYARADHPTGVACEEALGALDGGHALLYPSGMGAVTTVVLTMLRSGGTIALAAGAYYGHRVLFDHLAPWGVNVVEFDQTGPPPDEADLILVEAPANPLLTMPDLEAAAAHPAPVICDATVATPLRLRPLEHGCDVALHSATKILAGHDDVLAGVTVTRDPELRDRLHTTRRLAGIVAPADTAWLVRRGLETLDVRLARQEATAGVLAERLADHPAVDDRPLPGPVVPHLLRRARRRRRDAGRACGALDRERDEPRRDAHEARGASPLGGRPDPDRPHPALGRARGSRGRLGRSRAGARVGLTGVWRASARATVEA